MRLSAIGFLMILTTLFLSACEQQGKVAAVENRGTQFYGRNTVSASTTTPIVAQSDLMPTATAPIPANSPFKMASASLQAPSAPVTENVKSALPTTQASRWQWPVNGKVTKNFGQQANGTSSEGITIAANEGTPIHAAQAGEVAFVGNDIRNYGNIVILRHPDKSLTSYSHAREITVKKGQQVAAGGVIGYVGKSGSVKTPQLHFALREDNKAVDPIGKLPQHFAAN